MKKENLHLKIIFKSFYLKNIMLDKIIFNYIIT